MPTPSLLIVPARFKTGKLYSQIPTSGAGDFTVTRNTAARRFDSAGLVASVASGIPRLDYYTSGGVTGCPALLVEPAATNLALQSAGFQVSGTWVPENATITTGTTSAFIAPDGSTDADLLTDDITLAKHRVSQNNLPFTSGTTYAFSIFVKKNSSGRFLLLNANTAIGARAVLNLDTLAITNINGSGALVENYGNGWYRFSIRGTASATTAVGAVLVQMQDAATDANYIGNGSSFYLWGAQIETGSVATSYIPTTTAAVTRNADVVSVSGAVSGSIGQLSGTIYAEVDVRNLFAGTLLVVDDGDTSDFIAIGRLANLTMRVQIRRAGGSITTIITSSAIALGVHKIALAYTNGDYALYIDGVSAGTSTNSTNYPATSLTQCVLSNTNYVPLNDRILAAALYTTRLSNAELAALTA